MKRLLVTALGMAAVAALAAPSGRSADECRGIEVCIPIAGPWVAVPAASGRARSATEYQLRCPGNAIVGGVDARVSDRAVELAFLGALGSPVRPGVTTGRAVVFVARYVGRARRATTFRPFIGCIPTSGGGRGTTAVRALRPGTPAARRVRTARLRPGRDERVVHGCARGERLVGSSHAVAFRTPRQPAAAWLAGVRSSRTVAGGRVVVRARRLAAVPARTRVELQVHAICARARP